MLLKMMIFRHRLHHEHLTKMGVRYGVFALAAVADEVDGSAAVDAPEAKTVVWRTPRRS